MEVPDWQVHEYNADFYIIRESGCTHYEKPFIYLIFGKERAMIIRYRRGRKRYRPLFSDRAAQMAASPKAGIDATIGDALSRT